VAQVMVKIEWKTSSPIGPVTTETQIIAADEIPGFSLSPFPLAFSCTIPSTLAQVPASASATVL
jgi:hypothetical protein